ncbi:hypothetical protein [Cellulomonas aerilata]|uniref:hypothetical protein n=1 Tax=Cellulomonas aerilata TaxID=515326 RepID=UPI001649D090|nr:hypothetical protein [Cellulomonas aerilata]
MDGIAGIENRIAMIQTSLAALRPQPTVTSVASTRAPGDAATPSSATRFATALATEVSRTASTTAISSAAASAPVGGYSGVQLDNARAIVNAAQTMGLSSRDQAIGVMTAMGESSLQVLDHGDKAGPDSRGLFQQRDNGAWGTLAQRMDPAASATSFFTALDRVGGRDGMSPTQVAHTVQRNADPNHYAKHWDDAVAVVSRLTGATAAQITGR